ncbi:hypothetical protein CPC16_008480, partial [Podila verticillata]
FRKPQTYYLKTLSEGLTRFKGGGSILDAIKRPRGFYVEELLQAKYINDQYQKTLKRFKKFEDDVSIVNSEVARIQKELSERNWEV